MVTVELDTDMSHEDYCRWALETGKALREHFGEPLFFARYSDHLSKRVAFQIKNVKITPELREWFDRPDILSATFKKCGGSDKHAKAFELACVLEGAGEEQIGDVLHWLMNMTGYHYGDELLFYTQRSVALTRILLNRTS